MILACIFCVSAVSAQKEKDIQEQLLKILQNKQTSFQEFERDLGNHIKYREYKIKEGVTTSGFGLGDIFFKVRHYTKANSCFLILSEKNTKSLAMIDYNDLLEINKNLPILMNEAPVDCNDSPDYLDNQFKTKDGFKIGYYIENEKEKKKNEINWFISYDCDWKHYVIGISDIASMRNKLQEVQLKMESLLSEH